MECGDDGIDPADLREMEIKVLYKAMDELYFRVEMLEKMVMLRQRNANGISQTRYN